MIGSLAGNRNPVPPIIHVIDGALGRLLYFPVGYQRGLLHSSEIGPGESARGQERHFGRLDRCRLCPQERREMQPARAVAPYAQS